MSPDTLHVRYAATIARQLAAIEADDLAAFATLADERDDIAAKLERERIDEHAFATLTHAAYLDRALVQALRQRRDTLKARLDGENPASPKVRAYTAAAALSPSPSPSPSPCRFDVSL